MKDKLNIVIVGGGSTWCPGILKALTKHMDILPLNRVMLYDIDAERQRPIDPLRRGGARCGVRLHHR